MVDMLVALAKQLAAGLASGTIPDSAVGQAVEVEQVRRKVALCLLCLPRDTDVALAHACRAACRRQQLQRALAAAEREGGEEGAAVAALLRQAAALVGSQPARQRRR
ncbi:hypothetical protein ABPG75_000307 [Micractinium tetrahymenae]